MVVSGRGGGGGSGGGDGDGTRGAAAGAGAAPPRHLPGVRPRGASPARCRSAGGSGGAEPALPSAIQVNVVQAASPGALGRLPLLGVPFSGQDGVPAETRRHSGEADVPREKALAASLRSGSSHRMNWKSGRSHIPGPPPHPLQPPGWGSQVGTNSDLANFKTSLFALSLETKVQTSPNFSVSSSLKLT
uniref:protein argonaute 14-like n=1 Tax=Lonchura striata TaxID=40157 RepID=UPI000B4D49D0|nr:protein argonaute 14-like [Lonchura striata domestica]